MPTVGLFGRGRSTAHVSECWLVLLDAVKTSHVNAMRLACPSTLQKRRSASELIFMGYLRRNDNPKTSTSTVSCCVTNRQTRGTGVLRLPYPSVFTRELVSEVTTALRGQSSNGQAVLWVSGTRCHYIRRFGAADCPHLHSRH